MHVEALGDVFFFIVVAMRQYFARGDPSIFNRVMRIYHGEGVFCCVGNPVAVCFPYQYTPASGEPFASQKEVLKCDRPNRALVFQRVARLYRQVFRHLVKL